MAEIPNYDQYSLMELYQALAGIAVDRYPDTFAALKRELDHRESESRLELEDCYYRLDKTRWPEYEERLRQQIMALGSPAAPARDTVTEENKYQTFWRRVGAQIVDSLVVGIPMLVLAIALGPRVANNELAAAYTNEALQYLVLAYFISMHARFGQTVGKMATGVKVMDVSEDRPIGYRQALLRDSVPLVLTVASTVYLLVFNASYDEQELTGAGAVVASAIGFIVAAWGLAELATMLFNRKRRAVHDFIARSVVIRIT